MSSGNILAGAPELYMLEYVDDLAFTKPEVAKVNDPYICFARIVYHPSKREEAVPYWKNVFAETKGESGTLPTASSWTRKSQTRCTQSRRTRARNTCGMC